MQMHVMHLLAKVAKDLRLIQGRMLIDAARRLALTEISTLAVLADVHQMTLLNQPSVAHLPHQLGLDLIPKSRMRLTDVMLIQETQKPQHWDGLVAHATHPGSSLQNPQVSLPGFLGSLEIDQEIRDDQIAL